MSRPNLKYGKMETVVYRNQTYRRWPDSEGRTSKNYFYASYPVPGFLHRHVWEDNFGPIPKGYEVHHKDKITFSNEPNDLECMSKLDHLKLHKDEGFYETRKWPIKNCVTCGRKFEATGGRAKYCATHAPRLSRLKREPTDA